MSDTLYTPRPDTLAARVVGYFRRLPDEELTIGDIALKWHADRQNVGTQLQRAVDAGLLLKDGTVFTAGPQIGQIELSPRAIERAAQASIRKAQITPEIDIEAITFEEHVPLVKVTVRVSDRWEAKIRTMRAGQSFAVSVAHRCGLNDAATRLRKQGMEITIRREGATEMFRVFCLKALEVTA